VRQNRVSRIDPHARTQRTIPSFPPKRICSDAACSTVLSIYNASEFCFVHEPRRYGKNDVLR
jgi:hypothetical protein